MTVDFEKLIEALIDIFKHRNIQCAVKETTKGGVLAGSAAIIGGLLLGPVGLALGGAIGGVTAAAVCNGKYQSITEILRNMNYSEKRAIYNKLVKAFERFGAEDVVTLVMLLHRNDSLTELAIKETLKFIQNDMSMSLKQSF